MLYPFVIIFREDRRAKVRTDFGNYTIKSNYESIEKKKTKEKKGKCPPFSGIRPERTLLRH